MTRAKKRGTTRFRRRSLRRKPLTVPADPNLEDSSIILSSDVAQLNDLIAQAADFHQRAEDLEKDGHFDTAKELARLADGFLAKADRLAGKHERKKAAAKS